MNDAVSQPPLVKTAKPLVRMMMTQRTRAVQEEYAGVSYVVENLRVHQLYHGSSRRSMPCFLNAAHKRT